MRFNEFKLHESYDPKVAEKQKELVKLGYDLGPYGPKGDGVDGMMGPYTQAAIDAEANGIKPEDAPKPNSAEVQKFNSANGIKPTAGSFGVKPNSTGIGIKPPSAGLPVDGPVSSPFGYRTSVGKGHSHLGTDFAVPVGTKVFAPDDGVISRAGDRGGAEGIYSVLNAEGVTHKFFHLSKILAEPGTRVKKGEVIALTGNTGYSTGPHLHWETHVAGQAVDPMKNLG